ncbi:MAG: hypothetical protein E6K11_11330 [Methanobacteriota archaeon]|nr:MAG: hypothetical protein E6K11_11330 [Euryarchaeota archaeon]
MCGRPGVRRPISDGCAPRPGRNGRGLARRRSGRRHAGRPEVHSFRDQRDPQRHPERSPPGAKDHASSGLSSLRRWSMELVRGEDMASLIRRVGRLPSEQVIDIARQLCAGLAAAHAEGVLHRVLKPANVLIDDEGQARITDFGIAVASLDTSPQMLDGTPDYRAPEQLLPGAPLTERTDVYALGLLLYELVVGQHPFLRAGTRMNPPRPSTFLPDVNPQLERVVLQALSPDPRDRPASADAVAASLPTPARAGGTRKTNWWLVGTALVAVVALAILTTAFFLSRGTRALTEQDTIVLADFANTTGEPVFDGALKVALAVAVEQSPFLTVFPDERVRDTLRLMNRPPDAPVTRSVAREIAQREQLKALFRLDATTWSPSRPSMRSPATSWRVNRSKWPAKNRCSRPSAESRPGCARSLASLSRRYRNSTCRCPEPRRHRSRRSMHTRSRSTRGA